MLCKSCGHPNASNAIKCASCGTILDNERVKLFQAQAQFSKGVAVSLEAPESAVPPEQAENFFAEVAPPPPPSSPPPTIKKPSAKETSAPSFFSQVSTVEEPAFETQIGSLKDEGKAKGPPEHPLYSPPTNPVIEAYIARRAAVRK